MSIRGWLAVMSLAILLLLPSPTIPQPSNQADFDSILDLYKIKVDEYNNEKDDDLKSSFMDRFMVDIMRSCAIDPAKLRKISQEEAMFLLMDIQKGCVFDVGVCMKAASMLPGEANKDLSEWKAHFRANAKRLFERAQSKKRTQPDPKVGDVPNYIANTLSALVQGATHIPYGKVLAHFRAMCHEMIRDPQQFLYTYQYQNYDVFHAQRRAELLATVWLNWKDEPLEEALPEPFPPPPTDPVDEMWQDSIHQIVAYPNLFLLVLTSSLKECTIKKSLRAFAEVGEMMDRVDRLFYPTFLAIKLPAWHCIYDQAFNLNFKLISESQKQEYKFEDHEITVPPKLESHVEAHIKDKRICVRKPTPTNSLVCIYGKVMEIFADTLMRAQNSQVPLDPAFVRARKLELLITVMVRHATLIRHYPDDDDYSGAFTFKNQSQAFHPRASHKPKPKGQTSQATGKSSSGPHNKNINNTVINTNPISNTTSNTTTIKSSDGSTKKKSSSKDIIKDWCCWWPTWIVASVSFVSVVGLIIKALINDDPTTAISWSNATIATDRIPPVHRDWFGSLDNWFNWGEHWTALCWILVAVCLLYLIFICCGGLEWLLLKIENMKSMMRGKKTAGASGYEQSSDEGGDDSDDGEKKKRKKSVIVKPYVSSALSDFVSVSYSSKASDGGRTKSPSPKKKKKEQSKRKRFSSRRNKKRENNSSSSKSTKKK